MATVKYNAPDGQGKVTWNGVDLEHGKSVEVNDPMLLQKAQNNPFFEVSGFEPKNEGEVAGEYTDTATGEQVTLIKRARRPVYQNAGAGAGGVVGPSAAVQGSVALHALAPTPGANRVREVYGVDNPLESQEPGQPGPSTTAVRADDAPPPKASTEVAAESASPPQRGQGRPRR